ncbi:hypothetical protein PSTT_13548, partial [Puccinia striiformis]
HRLHITEIQLISSGRPMVRCSLHVRIRLQTSRILWSHCARGNDVVCAGHIASLGWADHATSMPVSVPVSILPVQLMVEVRGAR